VRSRVTRCVCKKIDQNVAQHIYCQKYCGKNKPNNLRYFYNVQ
jgi:hypothetical protein